MMLSIGPPKLFLIVWIGYFDFENPNSALPNSTLYTLVLRRLESIYTATPATFKNKARFKSGHN